MPTDYAKLKNAELEALLKERSLPHTGKKAEMVSRLQQDDKKKAGEKPAQASQAATSAAAAASGAGTGATAGAGTGTGGTEDEIDWDDEAVEPAADKAGADGPAAAAKDGKLSETVNGASKTAAATTATGNAASTSNVSSSAANVPPTDEKTTTDPKQPADAKDIENTEITENTESVGEEGDTATTTAPLQSFASGLADTTIEQELEKRRARAKKFGLQESDEDAIKALERAKRFGETAGPRGLNEALPERMAKKRGRDGWEGDDERGGRERGRGRSRGGGGGGGGRRGGGGGGSSGFRKGRRDGNGGGGNGGGGGGTGWMSAADREKAEARAKRFAAAS